jgi:CDP-diacylglycerol pyrophosphatase
VVSAAAAAAVGAIGLAIRPDDGALLSIAETKCVASAAKPNGEPPCVKIARPSGYVILKDRKGSHHFLLLPLARLSGIESDVLVDGMTPNFFDLAWENRHLLTSESGVPVADSNILLAINSKYGRSQNQLHIHIACIDEDVRRRLEAADPAIKNLWSPLAGELKGHPYWARRVSHEQFDAVGPFRLLAFGLPLAAGVMDRFSLAVTVAPDGDFILLATERNLLALNFASAEELQDQECSAEQ